MKKDKKAINDYSIKNNILFMFKNVLAFDKKGFIFFLLVIPISILLPIVAGLVSKIMIDAIVSGATELRMILMICGITFIMGVIKWLDPMLNQRNNLISNNLNIKYKIDAFSKLMSTNYEKIENLEFRKSYEKAKLFVDTKSNFNSSRFLINFVFFFMYIIGVISYIVILIIALSISWLILIFVIASVILFLLTNKIYQINISMDEKSADLEYKNNYLFRTSTDISAGKDMRIFSFSRLFSLKMHNVYRHYEKGFIKNTKYNLLFEVSYALLTLIVEGSTLFFLLRDPTISISNFVFYFGVATGFWIWIIKISVSIEKMRRISECAKYYRTFIDTENISSGEKFLHEIDCSNLTIEFQNVCYTYEGASEPTLKNINFTVKSGDRYAIVGRNGAGKTTCIKLLAGLYKPTSGKILLNGKDITNLNSEDYFHLMSVIFQDNIILPMTISENIALKDISEIDINKLNEVVQKADLKAKIDSLENGLDSKMVKKINDNAIDLSGGEKQKLLLARSLYKDAPILILDEPTAALDPIAENEMYEQYSKYSDGKVSFFISHRLASTRFCNQILFFKDGEIVEKGNHNELIKKGGEYANMFEVQSFYYKKSIETELAEGV